MYYILEVSGQNEIRFKEKEVITEKRVTHKSVLMKYLKSEDNKNQFFRNIQRESLEYLIYCFNYSNGDQKICNFYETDEIDLRLRKSNLKKNSMTKEEFLSGNLIENEKVKEKEKNIDTLKSLEIENNENQGNEKNNNDEKNPLKDSKATACTEKRNNQTINKKDDEEDNEEIDISQLSKFVYSVWIVDIEAIDLDPAEIIEVIEYQDEIKDMTVQCENLGDVFIELDPDLNDNGIVKYNPPDNAKEITVNREIDEEMLETIQANLEEEHIFGIHIRRNKFSNPKILDCLLDILNGCRCEKIVSFSFSENLNLVDEWYKVMNTISLFVNLNNLNLGMAFLYDKYLVALFNAIKTKRIVSLDISSNFITFVGARTIGKWIKGNRTLKELYVQQNTMNEFKREGFDFIAEPLKKHPNIEILDFSFMILTGYGVRLAQLIKISKTLKVLKIRNNRMNFTDYLEIIPALSENVTIEELYMNENNPMKEESIDCLAKLIKYNKKIHTLYLDKIGLSIENCRPFFLALKSNTTISILSLNDNPEVSVKKYIDFFKDSKTIKKLHLMVRNSNVKRTKEELRLLEKFKEERSDIEIKY